MSSCLDPSVPMMEDCVGVFNPADHGLCHLMPNSTLQASCLAGDDVSFPRMWGPWRLGIANFDNVFNALNMVTQVWLCVNLNVARCDVVSHAVV